MSSIEQFRNVVRELDTNFDSHQFIEKYTKMYERDYLVGLLKEFITSKTGHGVLRAYHSMIGRNLSRNKKKLGIQETTRHASENIKGYDSLNMQWRKFNQ